MKRVTSLLTLLLTWICVSMQAQVTPLTNVPDGDYFIACPAGGNNFAYYDGTNAYLRRSASVTGTSVFTLTQGTDDNAGKYTIQCGGKYVVAGTSLQHSNTAGENVKLVDEAETTNDNKWWVLAQDASNANLIDIFPYQANITATTPAWNFAAKHNNEANTAVGLWSADDGNSKWALISTIGGGDPQIAELKLTLQATLDAIIPKIGTALGQVVVNDNYTAARELLANPDATLEELRAETVNPASHYYTAILPEEGVVYYVENKNYPGKFLTTNSENQLTYSATPGRVLYERVPGTTDQVYIKVNGLYAGTCKQSTTVPAVSEQSAATPYGFEYYNGYIVMQDKVLGGWGNYLHCSNGTVVGWEAAAGATQWTVKPADEMLIEKIPAKLDEVDAHVGTKPGQVTTTAAYTAARALIAKDGVTLEELEAEYAKNISTYYTVNMPKVGVDYVLKNFGQSGYYMSSTGNNLNSQTVAGIVNFEAVDGQTDQFYIKVNGLYVGVCHKSDQVTLSNEKAGARRYSFGLYNWNVVMQDQEQTAEPNYAYLHSDGSHKIVGWENSNGCTQWILLSPTEATDLMFESLGFTAADKFDLLEGATVKYPNEFGPQQYNLTPEGINTAIDALLVVEDTPEAKKAFVESENGQLLLRYRTMLTNNPGWGTPIAVSFEMKAEYGTLILPFPVVRPDDLEVFTCAGVETNGTTLTLTPMTNNLAHNTPYIIKGAVGAKYSLVGFDKGSRMTHTAGCLTGVLNEGGTNVPGGSYVLSKYQDVLAFYMVENGVSKNCPQFKCYFTAPAGSDNAKAFFFNPGDVTGIDAIVTDGGKAEIYNVYGQRLNGLRKGLNIVNGRKVVVK